MRISEIPAMAPAAKFATNGRAGKDPFQLKPDDDITLRVRLTSFAGADIVEGWGKDSEGRPQARLARWSAL